jgi:DNA-binding Lrp family transcriptional regulator
MIPAGENGREPRRRDSLAIAADLTAIDRDVIAILQDDGRAPFAKIARQLGITEKTARRRVNDLVGRGVIQITTVADPELLGYKAIGLAALRLDPSRTTSDVAGALADMEAVDYVLVTTGRYHVIAELLCTDYGELVRIVQRDIATLPGVADFEIYPYLRLVYQEPRYQTARWKPRNHAGLRPGEALDEIDRRILRELNADGRVPFQAIARTLGVSESQVRHRVGEMLNAGSVRILAITNPRTVGFDAMAWIGVVAAPTVREQELAERLASLPSITYLAICAGRFDILAEMVCTNQQDLLDVLDEQIRPLEGIGALEVFVCVDLRYKRVDARPA